MEDIHSCRHLVFGSLAGFELEDLLQVGVSERFVQEGEDKQILDVLLNDFDLEQLAMMHLDGQQQRLHFGIAIHHHQIQRIIADS